MLRKILDAKLNKWKILTNWRCTLGGGNMHKSE